MSLASVKASVIVAATFAACLGPTARAADDVPYLAQAKEITAYIQKTFALPKSAMYAGKAGGTGPDLMWGDGVMLSVLVAAARYEPARYKPQLAAFVAGMDKFWDAKAPSGGYEPAPTNGNGHDKYYDDNAWVAISLAEAYDVTGDGRYLTRARQTTDFVLSGWDDTLGGGVWWHQLHKGDCKNTCANAPGAVACLRVGRDLTGSQAAKYLAFADKIVDWTTTKLQADDGLFNDNVNAVTGKVDRGQLTYNTALMLRAELGLYRQTKDAKHLAAAKRMSAAADRFVEKKTGAYRDALKWSHLMAEADLEMARTAGDRHAYDRAAAYAAYVYGKWKADPRTELIENAAIARTLWLMADATTPVGRAFWAKADRTTPNPGKARG